MKIGFLYIAIGRYDFFWKSFYESSERYFMQEHPCIREYFVFTDAPALFGEEENRHIHRIYQSDMGWPDNTMKRFHLFLTIREQLKDLDYLFFFNANMEFVAPVGMDILPKENGSGLVGALHCWYFDVPRWDYSYERRAASRAYIPYWKGKYYFQGSLIGGTAQAFLRMCEVCSGWIEQDQANNIIPIWHDESIANRYFIDNPPTILDCGYNYCEMRKLPIEKKILMKHKPNYISFDGMKHSAGLHVKQTYWEHAVLSLLTRLFFLYKRICKAMKTMIQKENECNPEKNKIL